MELAPDLLDRLGLAIREVGSIQLAVEQARLFWPGGEVRVALLLQAAWSGENHVELELIGNGSSAARRIRVGHGEVRRVRLPLDLPGGIEPLRLRVRAPIRPDATRIRPAWLARSEAAEAQTSWSGALFSALKQAVGKREKQSALVGPESLEIPIELLAVAGEPPLAAEDEAVWQPGMSEPAARALSIDDPAYASSLVSRADGSGERPECPNCFARAYVEQVREERKCPSCGYAWNA